MERTLKINDIRRQIAAGNTSKAISEMISLIEEKEFYNEAILYSSRFNELEKNLRLGIIDYKSSIVTRNQINYALIQLIQEIDNSINQPGDFEIKKKEVLVHFFDCEFHTSVLKMLIQFQNNNQDLFEFHASDWEAFHLKETKEKEFRQFKTNSKLEAVDKITNLIKELPRNDKNKHAINLIITSQLALQRYNSWNSIDKQNMVLSIGRLMQVFNNFNLVNLMVIRIIQRMLIYSMNFPGLKAHNETKHCVFDLTIDI